MRKKRELETAQQRNERIRRKTLTVRDESAAREQFIDEMIRKNIEAHGA